VNRSEDRLRAVVLSGGGANGAYEVGVLKALFAGKSPSTRGASLAPDIFTGTSIGSFNATYLVSHWDAAGSTAASDLETVWLDRLAEGRCGNGAYRFRFNPIELLSPACYVPNPFRPVAQLARDSAVVAWEGLQRAVHLVTNRDEGLQQRLADLPNFTTFLSNEPWFDSITQTINFETVRTSSRRLRIAATNWNTGALRIFRNLDMTDRLGPLAVMASSAIPGVFPEVMIGAEPHVDGGVLMNTPLKLATDSGASELHVIYLDPDVRSIPVSTLQSTIGTLYRQQVISWAQVVNDDIEDAAMINRGLEILGRVGEGRINVTDPELAQLAKSLHQIWRRLSKFVRYRPLTVHRYHPRDDLSSGALGMLNLDRGHLDELIQRGFMDAVTHDCDEAGCVIPNREEKAEIREAVAATTGELPAVAAAPAEPAAAMIPVPPPEKGGW
jgi:NTE family protein